MAPTPGQIYRMQHSALIKAAGATPDVEEVIKGGVKAVGPDSGAAARGIQGFATSSALTSISTGWQAKLAAFAGEIGAFGPKLRTSARNVKNAEFRSAENSHRVRSGLGS